MRAKGVLVSDQHFDGPASASVIGRKEHTVTLKVYPERPRLQGHRILPLVIDELAREGVIYTGDKP